ncbi:MAG: leucine-rich repeat domain-containing protein [Tannerella sp.]|jgi:hypothetical protein|nr:leucine-rich repeat domain-containing protein [Tannerella sp.]
MKKGLLLIAIFPLLANSQNIKTIHLETAGTLNILISEDEKNSVTTLNLSGRVNGDDINYIREMCGGSQFEGFTEGKLSHIDMEDVIIVQGGSYKCGGYTFYTNSLEIGESMFAYLEKLKTIKLPTITKVIRSSAFEKCTRLESIDILDNIFSIEHYAFYQCLSLEKVHIGKGLNEIGQWCFSSCPKLKYFEVSEDNPFCTSVDGILFSKDGKTLLYYPNLRANTYEIPSEVVLAASSFAGCTNLERIEIPEGTTEVNGYVFYECTGLKYIKLPNSLRLIWSIAFYGCSSLSSITLPKKVHTIYDAFCECKNLEEIICLNTTPPRADIFHGVNTIDAKVYVPTGSAEVYSKAEGWRNFLNIIEKDFETDNPVILKNSIQIQSISGGISLTNIQDANLIYIFNTSGQLIKHIIPKENNIELNLPKGIYIINIKLNTNNSISKKIVIS